MNWISVNQKLPEAYGQFIVFTCYGDVATCYYFTTRQSAWEFPDKITHWMTLPEPPISTNHKDNKE